MIFYSNGYPFDTCELGYIEARHFPKVLLPLKTNFNDPIALSKIGLHDRGEREYNRNNRWEFLLKQKRAQNWHFSGSTIYTTETNRVCTGCFFVVHFWWPLFVVRPLLKTTHWKRNGNNQGFLEGPWHSRFWKRGAHSKQTKIMWYECTVLFIGSKLS